jgi:hypothetical protein
MKIYRIEDNRDTGPRWDVFIGAVVVAESPEDAKKIHPSGGEFVEWSGSGRRNYEWVDKYSEIDVVEIGDANIDQPRGVIMDSYCAG